MAVADPPSVSSAIPTGEPPGAGSALVGRPDAFRRQLARLGWMFTAPALLVVAAVTIFPIVYSVVMSFSNVSVTGSGYSLKGSTLHNYSLVFNYGPWRYALVFTVLYTVVTVSIELIVGTAFALVMERLTNGRGLLMAILLIPWSLITVISAFLWKYMFDAQYGIIDGIIHGLGLGTPDILGTRVGGVIALCIADIWKTTPFVAIIVLAGLVMLPQDVYEAAEVDGADGWTTFWKITFPLLRPTIALAVLFRVLQAFGLFDLPFVLTNGGPGHATTSLAILGYQVMFNDYKFGPGAAIATTTALLVVIGCLLFLRVFRAQVGSEGN